MSYIFPQTLIRRARNIMFRIVCVILVSTVGFSGEAVAAASGPKVSISVARQTLRLAEETRGTVQLSRRAPKGGTRVQLKTRGAGKLLVPESVTVPHGKTNATFPVVAANASGGSSHSSIVATVGRKTASTRIKLLNALPRGSGKKPLISEFKLLPATLEGGGAVTASIRLSSALKRNTRILLSSSSDAVITFPTVTFPRGVFSTSFVFDTRPVEVETVVTVFVEISGDIATAQLTFVPPLNPPPPPGPPPSQVSLVSAANYPTLQAAIDNERFVYIPPGTYELSEPLRIRGWREGVIMGAGRFTTKLVSTSEHGAFEIADSQNVFIGNLSTSSLVPQGVASLQTTGSEVASLNIFSYVATGPHSEYENGPSGFRFGAPGTSKIQGLHVTGMGAGLSVEHPSANVSVMGGNYQTNWTHVRQLQGHVEVRSSGF